MIAVRPSYSRAESRSFTRRRGSRTSLAAAQSAGRPGERNGAADTAVVAATAGRTAKCSPPPAHRAVRRPACPSSRAGTSRCTARTASSPGRAAGMAVAATARLAPDPDGCTGPAHLNVSPEAGRYGWKPSVRFADGLDRTLAYYRAELRHYLDPARPEPACKLPEHSGARRRLKFAAV